MSNAYIVDAVRTPWGKYGGALRDYSAPELAAVCIQAIVERNGIEPGFVDNVLLGQVVQGGSGMHPARQALVAGGLPASTPATVLNKVCGSSLMAVAQAARLIALGEASAVVAGGMESMTNAPYYDFHTRWGARKGDVALVDGMMHDGLLCTFEHCHMAVHTDAIACDREVPRDAMDEWALESQLRWARANEAGAFERELLPVPSKRNPAHSVLERDESPRPKTTRAILERMSTVFDTRTITPGNSPGLNDGAAALLVLSEEAMRRTGAEPIARVAGWSEIAVEPGQFPIASAVAIRRLAERTGVTLDEIDIVEINEAFAAIPLICGAELGVDLSRANAQGGAVAMGHPIGATGARLAGTAAYQLQANGSRYAMAAICSGSGQGDALLLERP